jgi:hypothetical protein
MLSNPNDVADVSQIHCMLVGVRHGELCALRFLASKFISIVPFMCRGANNVRIVGTLNVLVHALVRGAPAPLREAVLLL